MDILKPNKRKGLTDMAAIHINKEQFEQIIQGDKPVLVLYKNGKAVDSIVNPGSKAAMDQLFKRLWQSKEGYIHERDPYL